MTICPYCKCKEKWYISASGKENVYQCKECSKYFKVKAIVPNIINSSKALNANIGQR